MSRPRKHSNIEYYWKTTKWLLGNLIFGLFPILFMCAVYYCSERKIGLHEIEEQVYEGTILFVCLALVGSVVLDLFLSGLRFEGTYRFLIYFVPAFIVGVVSLNYLL